MKHGKKVSKFQLSEEYVALSCPDNSNGNNIENQVTNINTGFDQFSAAYNNIF